MDILCNICNAHCPHTVFIHIHDLQCDFSEYLKDHERIKKNVCKKKPDHQLCGGEGEEMATLSELEEEAGPAPTHPPTLPLPEKISVWAWQNLVVYASTLITLCGILVECGCFEKSLSTKIAEAQNKLMQPMDDMLDAEN